MKRLLLVANVSKEHIRKFHIPFIIFMKENGWIVDVACRLDEKIPEADHQFDLPCNRNPFSGGIFSSIQILKKIINKGCYDVVHCNTITGSIVARIASRQARKKGTKVFYTNHGLHYFEGAPVSRWIVGLPMEKMLAPLTDCFITINRADYKMVKKTLKVSGNIEMIHGIGVNLDMFRNLPETYSSSEYRKSLGISQEAFVLIYVAELIKNKNQKVLLESMKRLKEKYPQMILLLVGPDHEDGALAQYANELEISDKVQILGWRNDIPELLTMSNLYVASSKSEGLGLNIIEALACGLPVIAYKNRGHSEIIKDGKNGFLIDQGDIDSFTQRIIDVYEDESVRAKITKTAQHTINKYSTQNVLNELWSIYQTNS